MHTLTRRMRWALVVVAVASGGASLAGQTAAPPAEVEIATAPVVVDGVELFRVRGVSSYPADTRAASIEDRIAQAAADPGVLPASVRIVDEPGILRIVAGD